MRFNCNRDKKAKWHRWFAWYSVRVAPNDCRWLEYVQRKGEYQASPFWEGWVYEYRPLPEKRK